MADDDWVGQVVVWVFLGILAAAGYGVYAGWKAWRSDDPGCFYFVKWGEGFSVISRDPGGDCVPTAVFWGQGSPGLFAGQVVHYENGEENRAATFVRDSGRKVCRVSYVADKCP